jgi:spore germination protein YaaH
MKRALLFLLSTTLFATAQPKALFYMTESPNSVQSFLQHADKVDILVPAWYSTDGNGLVWGGPNPAVMKSAVEHHVPVMPIVALMIQADRHKLLTTQSARQAFIDTLLSECKKNGYSGFQIDFENVNWTDRDVLSEFVVATAFNLHRSICNSPSPRCRTPRGFPARATSLTGSMRTGADRSISKL